MGGGEVVEALLSSSSPVKSITSLLFAMTSLDDDDADDDDDDDDSNLSRFVREWSATSSSSSLASLSSSSDTTPATFLSFSSSSLCSPYTFRPSTNDPFEAAAAAVFLFVFVSDDGVVKHIADEWRSSFSPPFSRYILAVIVSPLTSKRLVRDAM